MSCFQWFQRNSCNFQTSQTIVNINFRQNVPFNFFPILLWRKWKVNVWVAQSCLTLCDPVDYSLSGSSVHGILQAKHWSGLLFPSPRDLPDPRINPRSSALQTGPLPSEPPGNLKVKKDISLEWLAANLPQHGISRMRMKPVKRKTQMRQRVNYDDIFWIPDPDLPKLRLPLDFLNTGCNKSLFGSNLSETRVLCHVW